MYKMYIKLWVTQLFLLYYLELCRCQQIELVENNQQDSVSQCSLGIIESIDTIALRSQVNFQNASIDWGRYAQFQLKTKSNSYTYMVSLKNECLGKQPHQVCYCESSHNEVYNIVCLLPALQAYSNARFQGSLTSILSQHKETETRLLPHIFDLSRSHIIVNDQIVRDQTCHFHVKETEPAIRACCELAPSPCKVWLYNRGRLLGVGEGCINITLDSSDAASKQFTLEYQICGERRACACSVTLDGVSSAELLARASLIIVLLGAATYGMI
ncbi:hypothetical protein BgiBS90_018901 [Biomphalaria glabrata]|nr:hypothetical protein BgiBS90_018901 [Biomphalaria glabrata]